MAYPLLHPLADTPKPEYLTPEQFSTSFPEENEHVEFEAGFGQDALAESAVAFTNTEGGVILIGVDDAGRVVGASLSASNRDKIHRALANVHSPGDYEIRRLRVGEQLIVVVSIAPRRESFAQTPRGRVLVRRGTMRVALLGNELAQFMFQRSLASYERMDTGVALDRADSDLLKRVTKALGIREQRELSRRLAERGLVQHLNGGATLTVAGALCLLRRPADTLGKTIVEVTRHPTDTDAYDRRVTFDGPADEQVVKATEFAFDELGAELVVLGLRRHELARVPLRVLREAIANAVAHRSYELRGTAIRVELRPDRVEILSPGLLPPPVTVETMRDSQAARNDTVLTVLRAFDLAEARGLGVDLIQDRMRDELLEPPIFEERGDDVVLTLPVRGVATSEERAWVREVEARGDIEPRDRILLVAARRGEALTNARARALLNVGRDEATRALRRLTRAGLVEKHGVTAGTSYTLKQSLRPPAGLRLTRAQLLDTVEKMASSEEPVTNARVRDATGLQRNEVLGLLDELVQSGRLVRVGQRRGTRYLLPR